MLVECHEQMCRFLPDWSDMKVHLFAMLLQTSKFGKGPCDMDQNAS